MFKFVFRKFKRSIDSLDHQDSLTYHRIVSTLGAAITIWRFTVNDQSNRLPKFR